jgi:hypothetical protein
MGQLLERCQRAGCRVRGYFMNHASRVRRPPALITLIDGTSTQPVPTLDIRGDAVLGPGTDRRIGPAQPQVPYPLPRQATTVADLAPQVAGCTGRRLCRHAVGPKPTATPTNPYTQTSR